MGLLLGIPLAIVSRAGLRPKRDVSSLVRPVVTLLAIMGSGAVIAGALGGLLGSIGVVFLVGDMAEAVPADRHVAFLIDLWAHSASYLIGFVGGVVMMVKVWRSRGRAVRPPAADKVAS